MLENIGKSFLDVGELYFVLLEQPGSTHESVPLTLKWMKFQIGDQTRGSSLFSTPRIKLPSTFHLFVPRMPYEVAWRAHHRKSMRVDFIQGHFWSGQVSSRESSSTPCRVLCLRAVRVALRKLLQLWLRDSPISSRFPPLSFINRSIDLSHHSYTFIFWLRRSFWAPSLLNSSRIEILLLWNRLSMLPVRQVRARPRVSTSRRMP